MNALNKYVKHFVAAKAHEQICADLQKQIIRELRKNAGGANIDGVDLCIVNTVKRTYAPDIQACLDELAHKVEEQKKIADDADKIKYDYTPHVKGTIPKSTKKQILSRVRDYAKYFGSTK